MLDNWQRIEQIIKWTGCASVSAFAREIGLNRSENLYQIKRGNNGISKDLAEVITIRYPGISKAWLLTGEGEMLPREKPKVKLDIPLYKMDAAQLLLFEENPEPACHVSFPVFKGCDFAAHSFSGVMEPDIPRGSIVFFQKSDIHKILPGEIYLIISKFFNGIRIIRKEPDSSEIRLVARNAEEYDEVVIRLNDIEKLYLVRGIVINRSI